MNSADPSRRRFLAGAAAALTAAAGTRLLAQSSAPAEGARSRRRVLRIAHLTDTHVMPNREGFQDSGAGLARAIRHAQGQADRPDAIFFGGDLVMDSLKHEKAEVLEQWDVWKRVVAAEVKLPYRLCLGNHDIWGWALRKPGLESDPQYGKGLALDILGMKERYYSFDQAGWHFVVLDSMQIDYGSQHGYTARIDDAQFAWLAQDLAATPRATPVFILSHIPILGSCVFFDDDLEKTGSWSIPGAWMHIDVRRLKDLFYQHPNVKVCVSGHVHLVDDVTYLGVRYLCNGALCGGWWKGNYQEFGPAYALVDLFDDGSVNNQLVNYNV
jgi:3',5'-cyclic AMP phosphodiesterase CpdA